MTRKDIFCIRGNHYRNFLAALSDDAVMESFSVKYGSSFRRAQDELSLKQVDWIRNLPKKLILTQRIFKNLVIREKFLNKMELF